MTKSINSKNDSGLYSGNIKLTLKKKDKPYKVIEAHNAGTYKFFAYILEATRGFVNPDKTPTKIKLIYYGNVISKFGVIFESISSPESTGTEENPKASIKYKFIVPETIVQTGSITGVLLENNLGEEYARVYFDGSVIIDTNTNIELEWVLSISNNRVGEI